MDITQGLGVNQLPNSAVHAVESNRLQSSIHEYHNQHDLDLACAAAHTMRSFDALRESPTLGLSHGSAQAVESSVLGALASAVHQQRLLGEQQQQRQGKNDRVVHFLSLLHQAALPVADCPSHSIRSLQQALHAGAGQVPPSATISPPANLSTSVGIHEAIRPETSSAAIPRNQNIKTKSVDALIAKLIDQQSDASLASPASAAVPGWTRLLVQVDNQGADASGATLGHSDAIAASNFKLKPPHTSSDASPANWNVLPTATSPRISHSGISHASKRGSPGDETCGPAQGRGPDAQGAVHDRHAADSTLSIQGRLRLAEEETEKLCFEFETIKQKNQAEIMLKASHLRVMYGSLCKQHGVMAVDALIPADVAAARSSAGGLQQRSQYSTVPDVSAPQLGRPLKNLNAEEHDALLGLIGLRTSQAGDSRCSSLALAQQSLASAREQLLADPAMQLFLNALSELCLAYQKLSKSQHAVRRLRAGTHMESPLLRLRTILTEVFDCEESDSDSEAHDSPRCGDAANASGPPAAVATQGVSGA